MARLVVPQQRRFRWDKWHRLLGCLSLWRGQGLHRADQPSPSREMIWQSVVGMWSLPSDALYWPRASSWGWRST